jgi:hypothetical protein
MEVSPGQSKLPLIDGKDGSAWFEYHAIGACANFTAFLPGKLEDRNKFQVLWRHGIALMFEVIQKPVHEFHHNYKLPLHESL